MAEADIPSEAHDTAGAPAATMRPLPADALIIVPVRNTVLFPSQVLPITIGRPRSIAAAQQALRDQRQVGILMQRNADADDPAPIDMHRMGTVANVVRYITAPDGSHHLVCQGDQRFQVTEFLSGWPFFVARVLRIPEPDALSAEIEARFLNLKAQATEAVELLPQAPAELLAAVQAIKSPAALSDLMATYMDISPDEKQEILETVDITARMEKISRMLAHRIEVLRLSQEIGRQTKASLDERQREVLLREQMAAIQRQLGEGEEGKASEIAELNELIAKARMPKEVDEQARKEVRRLQRMPEAAAEYGMIRTYLDWLIELPWALPEEKPIDIAEFRVKGGKKIETWAGQDGSLGAKGQILDGIAVLGDRVFVNALMASKLYAVPIGENGAAGKAVEIKTDRVIDRPDGMRSFGGSDLLVAEGGGKGALSRVTISGDTGKSVVLKEGFPDGPVAVTVVGTTAYVLEGQLALMMNPPKPGETPPPAKPYKATAVEVGKP